MYSPRATPGAAHYAGIELMRGIAAFGVISIHAGVVVHNRVTFVANEWQYLFTFVVPFFLLTSFFFAVQGERMGPLGWREWARLRLPRLLVPYLVWSGIYVGLRVARFYLAHRSWGPEEIFHDPVKILVTGGTSLALYFLPLLLVGWMLIRGLRSFLLGAPVWMLIAGLVVSAASNQVLQQSGNGYDIASGCGCNVLFPNLNEIAPVRLLLVVVAHGIRCLPLILVAALAVRYLPEPNAARTGPVLVAGALLSLIGAVITLGIGNEFTDLTSGSGAFLLAWGISAILAPHRLITIIGAFSFGVYLVHQIVLELMQAAFLHLARDPVPVGLAGVMAISLAAFVVSMLLVGLASRGGAFLRLVVGLK